MASASSRSTSNAVAICQRAVNVGVRQVDLVHHRDDREALLEREPLATVCACTPSCVDEQKAPSHAPIERDTSYEKSTWPGDDQVDEVRRVAVGRVEQRDRLRLDGDPRSRSTARVEQLRLAVAPPTAPVSSISRSASVDLPWSTCEMMQKLRTRVGKYGGGDARQIVARRCRSGERGGGEREPQLPQRRRQS